MAKPSSIEIVVKSLAYFIESTWERVWVYLYALWAISIFMVLIVYLLIGHMSNYFLITTLFLLDFLFK